jgi:hypothetical protein
MPEPYGFAVALNLPPALNIPKTFSLHGIDFAIGNDALEVRYSTKEDKNRALEIAQEVVDVWAFSHGITLKPDFDLATAWEPNEHGGVDTEVRAVDRGSATDSVDTELTTVDESGNVQTTSTHGYSLAANVTLTELAVSNKALRQALRYYNNEALDEQRPLYGIYKAIEAIAKRLPGGRQALGKLANQNRKFVEDVMQTANSTRHAYLEGEAVLTVEECKRRAHLLITAYSASLPPIRSSGNDNCCGADR